MKPLISLFILIPTFLFSQEISDWTTDLKTELGSILWLQQANDGTLVVAGNKGLAGIDHKTGDVLWINSDQKRVTESNVVHVDPLPFMMLETVGGKANLVMIETHSGEIITNSKSEDFTIMNYTLFSDDGIILFELKENDRYVLSLYDIAKNTTRWKLPIDKAKKGLKGLVKGQTPFLANVPELLRETVVLSYQKKVMSVDMQSGSIVWSKEFDDKIDELFRIEDELFIGMGKHVAVLDANSGDQTSGDIELRDDLTGFLAIENDYYLLNQKGFNLFNAADKTVKWEKPDKIKQTDDVYKTQYGYVSVNRRIANRVEEVGSVALIDEQGTKLWQKSFDGTPLYVFPTLKGVFYLSAKESNVFKYADGKKLFKKGVKITDNFAVTFDEVDKEVVIYSDNKLSIFNVESGKLRVIAEDLKLKKFDSDSDYLSLELRTDGYFLSSSHNTAFIGRSGDVKYNNYYPPVKTGFLLAAAMGIANSYGANISDSNESFSQQASLMSGVVVSGEQTNSSRQATNSVSSIYSGDNEEIFNLSVTRFNATSETQDFMFVFTKSDGKNQLYKIDKDNGEIVKKFVFKEKDPTYLVDEYDQRLYFLEKAMINSVSLN